MLGSRGKQDVSNDRAQSQPVYRSALVAIVGPDGTGKSTTIEETRKRLEASGSSISRITRHWRPALLPALGKLKSKENGEAQFGGPPRRLSGRFQFLRLAYYGVDFIAGHFLRDNVEKKKNQVIFYDRCALDMYVDPLRYGLKSSRGTRLLWNIVPRPNAIVLLYDSPARILARKAELSGAELQRQFAVWVKLLAEEQVDAVVRINAEPEEIGRRIASYLSASDDGSSSHGLVARRTMLECALRMLAGNGSGSNAKLSMVPDSSGTSQSEFAVVPSLSAPRFLIPLGSRKSAANSLRTYSAHKPLARAYKWTLTKALKTGLAQPFLRHRIFIHEGGVAPGSLASNSSLRSHLAHALGVNEVFLGVSLGTPGAHQKPLFQVMDREGRALGYAKIGWNQETIRIVQNEAQALQGLAGRKFTNASIPRVLIAERWNGDYLLLQSGPPSEKWSPSRDIAASHVQFLKELNQVNHSKGPLQESHWWRALQERITALDAMGAAYDADLARWALDECAVRFGETDVCFGMKHGDFTSWNLLQQDGELFVLDWEYADSHAPFGFDIFHFAVLYAALVSESWPRSIARDILGITPLNRRLRNYFADLGIDASLIDSYLALYAADTLSWHLWRDRGRKDKKSDAWRFLLVNYIHRST